MFEQGNKVKVAGKLNKEGHLERPCYEKREPLYLMILKNVVLFVSKYIISNLTGIITFQPM
jgi:hypothetical protein